MLCYARLYYVIIILIITIILILIINEYTYAYIYIYICINIYTYIHREREREYYNIPGRRTSSDAGGDDSRECKSGRCKRGPYVLRSDSNVVMMLTPTSYG